MIGRSVEWYEKSHELYVGLYDFILTVYDTVKRVPMSMEEGNDLAFVMKKTAELFKDLEKEARRTQETVDRLNCVKWVAKADAQRSIRSKLSTGTPKIRSVANMPSKKRDPIAYEKFCKWLGLSDAAINDEVVRPHFPGVSEMLTTLATEGKPLPPGIAADIEKPVYSVTHRGKTEWLATAREVYAKAVIPTTQERKEPRKPRRSMYRRVRKQSLPFSRKARHVGR